MRNLIFAVIASVSVTGCTMVERGATTGAIAGAAVGGLATGEVEGAVVGGAVGAAAGALIGAAADEPGRCAYRDAYGRRYIAECPDGYL